MKEEKKGSPHSPLDLSLAQLCLKGLCDVSASHRNRGKVGQGLNAATVKKAPSNEAESKKGIKMEEASDGKLE